MKEYSVISNTTPLIAFIKKNELAILKSLFNEIIIPKAVHDEIINIPKNLDIERKILEQEIKKKWIIIKEVTTLKIPDINLGKGETEAINLCINSNNPLLLIDEKRGRNIAKTLNIEVLGTLGIFALANKKSLKNKQELLENLDLLVNRGFYISSEVILSFLNELKI
jgi:predicted nucleic acid-binding protein